MESVYDDSSMKKNTEDDVYSLHQLGLGKKFINDSTSALLLKNALICWTENSLAPTTKGQYDIFEENFRKNFFWKQLEMKDTIVKKFEQNAATTTNAPTERDLKALKDKIDRMVDDNTLATTD